MTGIHYCYDPQKQLNNAIAQWKTMTSGLKSFKIQHRKVSLSADRTLPKEWECTLLRYEINFDITNGEKTLIRLLNVPNVNVTQAQC